MEYNDIIFIIKQTITQYKNGYAITQTDYNNFSDALEALETMKKKMVIT